MPLAAEREGDSVEQRKLRATQTLVNHMAFCRQHPSLTAIEVAWRWLFGIPFLMLVWAQAKQILAQIPPESVGLDRVELQNPWLSSVLLAEAVSRYEPSVILVLHWLLPLGVVGWAIASGLGRSLIMARMSALDPIAGRFGRHTLRQLPGFIGLQGLWMLALLTCFWIWYRAAGWASATYITIGTQPDLVGYLCWLIFFSLGIYTLWALLSWTLAVAPVLLFLEEDVRPGASIRALLHSFSLGKTMSSKLMEVSLVLSIVKIMLIVLDMVFSAAPLPFADEFGPGALHVLYIVIAIAFLIGNDYFYVVRLRSFVAFWKHYRGFSLKPVVQLASTRKIDAYANLEKEFVHKILNLKAAFLSDESSLWDFQTEVSLKDSYARIREVYKVDVSDLEGALIWKILERISEQR